MSETRKWVAGAAVLALVVLAAGWFFLVAPQRAEARSLRQQKVEQDSANDRLRARISQLQAQERDLPEQELRLAELREQIPNGPRLPELLTALTAAAKEADVELVTLAPQPPAPLQPTLAPAVAAAPAAVQGPQSPLLQIPLSITVRGGYFQIEAFLSRLEELRRSVLVTGLTLAERSAASGSGAAPSPAAQGSLEVSITARAFLTGPAAGAATGSPAAPARQGG